MSRAIAAKRFLRQPTYPAKIDTSHPIGKKVTAAISAHYGDNVGVTEMVSGKPGASNASQLNFITTGKIGKAFRPSTTSSGVLWPAAPAFCDSSQPYSVELLFTYLGPDSQFSRVLDFGGAGGFAGGWDLEIDATSTTLDFVTWNISVNNTPFPVITGMTVGTTYHLVVTSVGATGNFVASYLNGVFGGSITGGTTTTPANKPNFYLYTYEPAEDLSAAGCAVHLVRLYQGTQLTPGEVAQLYLRPYEMFRKPKRIFANTVAGGAGITGTAAWTEAQDGFAATGTITTTGTAAWPEIQDSFSAQGTVTTTGIAAWTEAQDSFAATGTVQIAGSAAWTEALDSVAATGALTLATITGTAAWVEVQDLFAGVGGNIIFGLDTHDGSGKRREKERKKKFEQEVNARARRKQQIIAAFAKRVDGKLEISESVAEEIIATVEERQPMAAMDFQALLNDTQELKALWRDYLERDDEEVLKLL